MSRSEVIPDEVEDQFWSVVGRCLREFHADDASMALGEMGVLKTRLRGAPVEEYEIFFHSEPFDVACALAGRPLKVEDHLARYLEIRDGDDAAAP